LFFLCSSQKRQKDYAKLKISVARVISSSCFRYAVAVLGDAKLLIRADFEGDFSPIKNNAESCFEKNFCLII
jgi:hypothetical protein